MFYCKVIFPRKIIRVENIAEKFMEPSEAQYLIVNALETLELLQWRLYDEETGYWRIHTLSPVLPIAYILQNGDIVPSEWILDL